MGPEHADRLAGLHQQALIVLELPQALENLVETFPVARGAADTAVDDELFRLFGNLGIEVVLDHAVGGFGEPALAGQFAAARGADLAAVVGSV